jgi:hypothetical protein
MKYFVGLDVSLQETAICIIGEDGIVISEGKTASEPGDLARWIGTTGLTMARVGLEAGPLSPWLYAELRAAGLPAICIETRRMKGATAAMAVKTDRNDARAIAHAMRVGWFTTVHVKTAESQELRLLLSNRRTLLEKRVAIDNESAARSKLSGSSLVRSPSPPSRRGYWNCSLTDRGCRPWSDPCSLPAPPCGSNAKCSIGWCSRLCGRTRYAGACSPCRASVPLSR